MSEQMKLEACPFCGGEAEYAPNPFYNDMSMARCRQCGAEAFYRKWNTRLRAERPGWRTMESAPKDGTEILVARGRQMGVVFWNGTRWSLGCAIYFNKPDVWQPLPALHPSVAEGRGDENSAPANRRPV